MIFIKLINWTFLLFFFHLLGLDETCVCQMDLVDGPLVDWHVSIVATLKWYQITSLDDVRLWKIFKLDILILQIEVTKLAFTATILLATSRALWKRAWCALTGWVLCNVVDLCSPTLLWWNISRHFLVTISPVDLIGTLWLVLILSIVFLNAWHALFL